MQRQWHKTAILIFVVLGILSLVIRSNLAQAGHDQGGKPGSTPQGGPEKAVEKAVLKELEKRKGTILAAVIFDTKVQNIRISRNGQWAAAEIAPYDPQAEIVLPVEPGLSVLRRQNGEWKAVFPQDRQWKGWLQQLPEEVMSPEAMGGWLEVYDATQVLRPEAPFGGYKLPWPFGQTRYVSQSTAHDRWRSDGMDHFAWDFYALSGGSVTMWEVLAARPGKVYMRKDSEPNGCDGSSGCKGNYIVLKDESTYPVTYQLYLHLAQNSIPNDLQVGSMVNQGQFLGIADDTGFSTGHHLHFMVHTAAYSYWGTAVDITFDDVNINGGRPRAPVDKDYCTRPEDVCYSFRTDYVSGNKPDPEPPTGDISNITPGQLISGNMLTVNGWGSDVSSGFGTAQLLVAPRNGSWQVTGQSVSGSPFSVTVDLCQANLPVGPTGLGLRLIDKSGFMVDLPGLRWVTLDYACSPPPVPAACVPGPGQAALFDDINFQGTCKLFNPGGFVDGASLSPLGGGRASSVLLGVGARLTLYNQPSFSGRGETFNFSDSNLADNRIQTNSVYSLFVRSLTDQPFPPEPTWPTAGQVIPDTNSVVLVWSSSEGNKQHQVELTTPSGAVLTSSWLDDPWWSLADGQTLQVVGNYSWRVRSRIVEAPAPLAVLPKYPNQLYLPMVQQAGAAALIVSPWSSPVTFNYMHANDRVTTPVTEQEFNDKFANPPVSAESTTSALWTPTGLWKRETSIVQGPRGSQDMYFWFGERDASSVPNYAAAHSGALTSPPIKIDSATPYLRFWSYYMTENKPGDTTRNSTRYWDQRWVQVSVDGGPFMNLMQMVGEPGGEWQQSPYIPIPATQGQVIRLRFYFDTIDGVPGGQAPDNYYTGWLVDDTRILPSAAAQCSDANEPDNTPPQATMLAGPHQVVTNARICVGDVDYYAFRGTAAERVAIKVDARSLAPASPLDSVVELFDADGNSVLTYNDDAAPNILDSFLSYQLPRTGLYFFRVHHYFPYDGGTTYAYNLHFYQDGIKPQVSWLDLSNGAWVNTAFSRLSVQAVDGQSGVEKVEFFMHDSNWVNLSWMSLGQASLVNGAYSLAIDPGVVFSTQGNMALFALATDKTGNTAATSIWNLRTDFEIPSLSLQPLSSQQTTNAFRLAWAGGDVVSGLDHYEVQRKIGDAGTWEDLYAGTLLTARLEVVAPGQTYSYRVRSVDKAGNTSAYQTTSTFVPGAAALCASENAPDAGEVDNTPEAASPLTLGQAAAKSFCNTLDPLQADVDWVRLDVQAGNKYILVAVPESGSLAAPIMTLYEANGLTALDSTLGNDPVQPGSTSSLSWTPDFTGSVLLRIVNADPAIIGARYRLLGFVEASRVYLPVINR